MAPSLVLLLLSGGCSLAAAAATPVQEVKASDAWLPSDSAGHGHLLPPAGGGRSPGSGAKKNVLHIIVDDLRPVLNKAYRADYMVTPSFDKLAAQSLVFSRAFCQIAVCAPSRSSFMSGVRPDITAIFNFANNIRDPGLGHITTLPGQFLAQNYTVLGGGKTYHYDHPPYFDDTGLKGSWSSSIAPYFPFREYGSSVDFAKCLRPAGYVENAANLDPQACALDIPMEGFYDYRLSNHTMQSLGLAKAKGDPFFIMAGFRRPPFPRATFLSAIIWWVIFSHLTFFPAAPPGHLP